MLAYVTVDPQEDPSAIQVLDEELKSEGIILKTTTVGLAEIVEVQPFLYFRNPYVRFSRYTEIAMFHLKNPHFPKIYSQEHDILSYSPSCASGFPYHVVVSIYSIKPEHSPLPILLTTHQNPSYLEMALTSLVYSLDDAEQKIYIVGSQPDERTKEILHRYVRNDNRIEAVITDNNLGYAVGNFGLKFFMLPEFIHFEDDFILPEQTKYQLPYWTRQFTYRKQTADMISLRTSLENTPIDVLRRFPPSKKFISLAGRWSYFQLEKFDAPPIGGNGLYVDSCKLYGKPLVPPQYSRSDIDYCRMSQTICLADITVYHQGANKSMLTQSFNYMDRQQRIPNPERFQIGTNVRTGETKTIDLALHVFKA